MATTTTVADPRVTYLNHQHTVASWLLTKDHRRIGLMYLGVVTVAFFLGGVFASMIRLELATPAGDLVSSDTYNKMFTMHGVALVFFFSLNLAPMMFESFTSDRIWASHPPESFAMFQGPYGQKTAHYWKVVSPLALATFLLSLILNWQAADRRLWLVVAFGFFLAAHIPTILYFVPEQEGLIASASALSPEVLQSRASRWLWLNYFRMAAGVLAFVCLMCALLAPRVPPRTP